MQYPPENIHYTGGSRSFFTPSQLSISNKKMMPPPLIETQFLFKKLIHTENALKNL